MERHDIELANGSSANESISSAAAAAAATPAVHPSNGRHIQVVPLNDVPSPAGPKQTVATQQRAAFHTQQSTVTMRRQQAICVRRAQKQYGSAKSPNVVLDGLNMTVPKGTM